MRKLIDADKLWRDITSNIEDCSEILKIIDKQPDAESESMNRVRETTDLIIREFKTNSVQDRSFRNAARMIQDVMDGIEIQNSTSAYEIMPYKGEWIPDEDSGAAYGIVVKCSICGTRIMINDALDHNYCSECGAYMGDTL